MTRVALTNDEQGDDNMPLLNQYDNRIGNGALPSGVSGSANRAYVSEVPENQSTMGLLNRYTQQSSPLIQNARRGAIEYAAGRGMGNSSIAAGNAQRAAIDAAGAVAANDAGLMSAARLKNVDVLNAREAERAAENMQATMTGVISDANSSAANAQREAQLQLQRERLAYEGEQAGLGRVHDTDMGRMGYGFDLGRAEQQYGYQRGLNEQGYGFDLGRARQGADLDLRNASAGRAQDYTYGSARDRQQFEQQQLLSFMNNTQTGEPEFNNPEVANQMFSFYRSLNPQTGYPQFVNNNPYFR
jgi:hypothetical protein